MSSAPAGFVVVDYIVFACVIVISIGIGVFHAFVGIKDDTGVEYHLGRRKMRMFPLILSMLVTTQSSILMLGIPAETYLYGGIMLFSSFGMCASYMIGARIVVPMLYPLKLTTVSEYYQLRYKGKAVRLFIATCMILLNEIYIGVIVMAQAAAMEGVTRIPKWVSILAVSSSAVLYTSIGGIKAVIWTDVFQSVIMVAGLISVLIKGTIDAGGAAYVWEVNTASDRLDIFNVYLVSGPGFLLSVSLACGAGLVAYAYFTAKGCDPLKSKQLSNPNQLLPYMVVEIFRDYPGMSGMFLAAVTAATLSSVSSSLASVSSTTHEDFIKPHFPSLSDTDVTRLSRFSVVLYGAVGILISFLTAELPGSVFKVAISLMSFIGVPVSGVFLFSIFSPSATQLSVILGGAVSGCLMFWINLGSAFSVKYRPTLQFAPTDQCVNFTSVNVTATVVNDVIKRPEGLDALYSLSYLWLDVLGLICLLLVSALVSFFLGRHKKEDSDNRYLFSFGERICPCLPENIKKVVCCGITQKRKARMR